MDVFYYWKNLQEDLREGRIGWLKSERQKLGELKERYPSFIWAFKTPIGRKGELQLMAKLVWSDTAKVAAPKIDAASTVYYDPADPRTIFYDTTDSDEAIQSITKLLRNQYPTAFRSNFQGDNGIQVMDGDFLRRFQTLADKYSGSHEPSPAVVA